MFLSREINIKLAVIYENSYRYAILYKSCSNKQIQFNKYATNLKTRIYHYNFYFAFLIDIIYNIFTYIHIFQITSPELQPMAVKYTGHVISVCIT